MTANVLKSRQLWLHQTQDDGFHEIQLNGKQLVFLFMAATVVSVVIFLCGVLVGRGVRAEQRDVADSVGRFQRGGRNVTAAAAVAARSRRRPDPIRPRPRRRPRRPTI